MPRPLPWLHMPQNIFIELPFVSFALFCFLVPFVYVSDCLIGFQAAAVRKGFRAERDGTAAEAWQYVLTHGRWPVLLPLSLCISLSFSFSGRTRLVLAVYRLNCQDKLRQQRPRAGEMRGG